MPRNLEKLGKKGLIPYPLFPLLIKIVERAHENRNRRDLLTAGKYWEFLFYFIFLLTYLRFLEVDFFQILLLRKNDYC